MATHLAVGHLAVARDADLAVRALVVLGAEVRGAFGLAILGRWAFLDVLRGHVGAPVAVFDREAFESGCVDVLLVPIAICAFGALLALPVLEVVSGGALGWRESAGGAVRRLAGGSEGETWEVMDA